MLEEGQCPQRRLARHKMRNRQIMLRLAGHLAHRLQYISKMQQQFSSVESVVHNTAQIMFPDGSAPPRDRGNVMER